MTAGWIRADWPAPQSVVAGTTLRGGGVSRRQFESLNLAAHVGDDRHAVAENRQRFGHVCGLPQQPVWLRQAHGVTVLNDPRAAAPADAIVSRHAGTVCAVLTADCLPVLFAAQDGSEIAAAHAGWRGLSAGVLEQTVAGMSAPPKLLLAWMGPAISQPAFEVGQEVREAFVSRDPETAGSFTGNAQGRWLADLYGLARLRLRQAGVLRVFGGSRCTYAESDAFFSYRRDGRCGRMASFIFREFA